MKFLRKYLGNKNQTSFHPQYNCIRKLTIGMLLVLIPFWTQPQISYKQFIHFPQQRNAHLRTLTVHQTNCFALPHLLDM